MGQFLWSGVSARSWNVAEKIRPWRFRFWQHIQDPHACLARARAVLQLYADAAALLQEGIWVVCVDEKPSREAREAEQAPSPARRGHVLRQSPRYKRQGGCHLIAGLSVADGPGCGQSQSRKRCVEFQAFVQEVLVVAAQQRGVHTVALILDNGSTPAPKHLERWLQEQAAAQQWGVTFQVYWLPTNAAWLDQIEIWFRVLQRKLLQPNHFTSPDDLDHAIMDFIVYGNQTAKPIQWSYTVDKLERKLGMN